MKKVLSVAMASAMVLGMGANAFAIQYNVASNDTAKWPTDGLKFAGELYVTDKNGDIKDEATTAINDEETVDFEVGDTVWMPLYAKNQNEYTYGVTAGKDDEAAVAETVIAKGEVETLKGWKVYLGGDGNFYSDVKPENGYTQITKPADGYTDFVKTNDTMKDLDGSGNDRVIYVSGRQKIDYKDAEANYDVVKYYIGATKFKTKEAWEKALTIDNVADAFITGSKEEVKGTDAKYTGAVLTGNKLENGNWANYTGIIDKDWSINLIEKSTGVAELVEKAELVRVSRKEADKLGVPYNSVFVKVSLKDSWKTTSKETLKYYVYVADNKDNRNKTNEVWVSGKYANTDIRTVNMNWSNDASTAGLWEAKENGTAVFDYADKAFFTVKMYKGEVLFLDLTKLDDKKAVEEWGATDFEAIYHFDKENSNFIREGEIILVSDEDEMTVYEMDEEGLIDVGAEYVTNKQVAHLNKRVNGFVFNTKQLGNYVIAEPQDEEEVEDVEEPAVEEPAEEVEVPEVEAPKANPNTGAEDFVGLAVSLAVVSVAAAGALALKK